MNTTHSKDNRQILEEASVWFVEFRLGDIDRIRRRDFMRWLKRSPDHIRAYMEISGAYARLPRAGLASKTDIEGVMARASARSKAVITENVEELSCLRPMAKPATASRGRPGRTARMAACFALCFVGLAAVASYVLLRVPAYATQTAEHRSITLDDGSRVELNARTRVRIVFTATQRRIDLIEGQALFHVSKDAHRPFIVSTSRARVQALGTRFDVHLGNSGTTVTVLEGSVAVLDATALRDRETVTATELQTQVASQVSSIDDAGSPAPVVLAAGEQAIITRSSISRPARANVAAATAWTQGQFEFDETQLSDVVEEFNRYSRLPIVIESPELAAFRISGIYSSDDPRSLVRFLRNQPDLVVTETTTEIRIRRK